MRPLWLSRGLGDAGVVCLLLSAHVLWGAQRPATSGPPEKPKAEQKQESESKPTDSNKRIELNLLGTTDVSAGESRRNENVPFNLVDNNALKELNVRLGTTATIIREFLADRSYFGAEFGNVPAPALHVPATPAPGIPGRAFHGTFYPSHLNSVFSARSFFQVGGVKPSRSHKLLTMWYRNRAHAVAGVERTTATINQRRPNPDFADIRWVLNGSRGYFDAGRISLVVPRWRGLSLDTSYWFSKALDLGSSYTNTAYDQDSRLARSQSEFETHRDMKGPSSFDQTHAFVWRGAYALPAPGQSGWLSKLRGSWNVSAVVLIKTGIPFNVGTGSDGPGFGNVDGNGSDRPHLLDPSILGRTIGHPDTSRRLLPRAAFAFLRPTEQRGNWGRNVFRKGGIRNVNAALSRTWVIRREKKLTFRVESVNFLNTPQFAEPGFDLANPNFGQITNTLNDGRTFRFLLELAW